MSQSNFLNAYNFKVAAGTSIGTFRDNFKSLLNTNNWVLLAEDLTANTQDWRPPASETIGNANGFEAIRMVYLSNKIQFIPLISSVQDYFVKYRTVPYGGGTYRLNIGASIVTAAYGASGTEATTNLHTALVASSDVEVLKYTYTLNLGAPSFGDHILITEKVASTANPVVSYNSGNFGIVALSNRYVANSLSPVHPGQYVGTRYELPVDYGGEFIYWLSISSRTLAIATRTGVGDYGPTFVSWMPNVQAVSNTPNTAVIPIEMYLFSLAGINLTSPSNAYASTTHSFGNTTDAYNSTQLTPILSFENRFGLGRIAHEDLYSTGGGYSNSQGVYWANTISNNFNAIFGNSLSFCSPTLAFTQSYTSGASGYVPGCTLPDVIGFVGTATNESLHAVRRFTGASTLSTAVAAGDTSLVLVDASAFPTVGMVVLGNEIILYTGKTTNTLTGCSRAQSGTVAASYVVSSSVFPGEYYVKFNAAGLRFGLTKPS